MPIDSYPYELPPLPYAYNALEPYIDAETMRYHHGKHYQAYIDNLNAALAGYPKLQKLSLEQLLARPVYFLPQKDYAAILHNAGGVYNHRFFFSHLAPADAEGHKPAGLLSARIAGKFGSFEKFQEAFTKLALDVFGSGWACLALTSANRLQLYHLANQETTLPDHAQPVLLFDVWEHAYYLKYKNARAEYIKNLWNVALFRQSKVRKVLAEP